MIYVGVDVSKADHCLGAIDAQGVVVRRPVRFTQDAEGFARLASLLRELGGPESVTVGCEATGHYWVLLAEELVRLGYTPLVFNPILSCDAGRTSVRGRKSDEDDCLAIAKVLRDGGFSAVRLPDEQAGRLKRLCRYRQGAVERSANLKKRLVMLLDLVFPEFASCFSEPYGPTARAVLAKAPSARLLAGFTAKAFTTMVKKASHGRLGLERVQHLLATAKTSIAVQRIDSASELAIRLTLQELALLEEQIATFDREIEAIPVAGRDLLVTIPGIGPVLAAIILAEIGTIAAFRRTKKATKKHGRSCDPLHQLLAFAGLDPRIRTSGQWTGKVRMSKRGSRTLRTALFRAAFVASRDPAFKDTYERHKVTMKQPSKVALSHVARKVLQAVYGVLHHQTAFDPDAFKHGPKAKAAA